MSDEKETKGGEALPRRGASRRGELMEKSGGKNPDERDRERCGGEARNVWRRRGGGCVGDKDWSPLASGRANTKTAIFCSSRKKKKESGGRRRQGQGRSREGGIGVVVAIARRGGISGCGRSIYTALLPLVRYSGQAGLDGAAGLWLGCGWSREVLVFFSAVDGGRWSGVTRFRQLPRSFSLLAAAGAGAPEWSG